MATATIDNSTSEAIRLLLIYTAGQSDIWLLAGPSRASCRAHVMSALMGRRMPQSKSGVTAILAEFYSRCGIVGGCSAERDDNWREFCRAQTS